MKKLIINTKTSKIPPQRANTILLQFKNNFFLLGGGSRIEEFNDIWSLSITQDTPNPEGQWKLLNYKGETKLPPRIGVAHSLVENLVFLHGGQNFNENKHFDDFYTLNLESLELNEIKGNNKTRPDRRNSHTMVYDKLKERLIIFGGADEDGPLDTFFYYYIQKDKWEEIPNKFKELKAREMHTSLIYYSEEEDLFSIPSVKKDPKPNKSDKIIQNPKKLIEINFEIPENESKPEIQELNQQTPIEITKNDIVFEGVCLEEEQKLTEESFLPENKPILQINPKLTPYLFIIGGRTLDGICSDIIAINLNKWTCKKIMNLPHGLCTHCSTIVSDKIYIYGGTDGLSFLNYLYCYEIKNGFLKKFLLEDELKSVGNRIAASITADNDGKNLVIFGGSTFEEEKNDVILINLAEINFQNV